MLSLFISTSTLFTLQSLEKLDTLLGEVSGKTEAGKNQGSLEKQLIAGLGHIKYKMSLDHLVPE